MSTTRAGFHKVKEEREAAGMAPRTKYVFCKHEDQSLDPRNPLLKKPAACNLKTLDMKIEAPHTKVAN